MTAARASLLGRWLPVVAWAAVIFAFSSVPSLSSGLGDGDLYLRKTLHVAEFAILAALLLRAVRTHRLALVLGALYAASDEVHQHFVPGREGRPIDVAFDTAGLVVGLLLAHRLGRAFAARRASARAGTDRGRG